MSTRVVPAAEGVPARNELQAVEEEAVRALEQIADAAGRQHEHVKLLHHDKYPEGGHGQQSE